MLDPLADLAYEYHADEENRRKLDRAVPRARAQNLIIKMACFNKQEADGLHRYATATYPDVEFAFTWLVFY